MNIKHFIVISIMGLILFNGISLLLAATGLAPYEVNILIDVIAPIAIGFALSMEFAPRGLANRS